MGSDERRWVVPSLRILGSPAARVGLLPEAGCGHLRGELGGDGISLTFSIGSHNWKLNPEDESEYQYTVHYETINGVHAKLLIASPGQTDPAAEYQPATGVHFRDFGGGQVNVVGRGLTPGQQRTAVAIFRGIRRFQ